MKKLKLYWLNVAMALDHLLNAATGGDYRETCSSRLGRYKDKNRLAKILSGWLGGLEHRHTTISAAMNQPHDREVWK